MEKENLNLIVQENTLGLMSPDTKNPLVCLSRTYPTTISLGQLDLSIGAVYENPIYAVLGIVPLLGVEYLLLATNVTSIGAILGCSVYTINEVDLFPIGKAENQTPQQRRDEEKYKELIIDLFRCGLFYYSREIDISSSIQRLTKIYGNTTDIPFKKNKVENLWNDIDDRFVWNSHFMEKLIPFSTQFSNYFPPVIQGFFESKTCSLNSKKFDFCIISRRSKKRAGTRFNSRGSDLEGNPSNFVETEQVLEFPDGSITSFVQIRGSIPLHWSQDPTMAYEPSIKIENSPQSDEAFIKHFEEQNKLYGLVVVVNLLKTKGKESQLHLEFDKRMKALDKSSFGYVFFDLHHHCGTSRFDKLSLLVDQINSQQYLDQIAFFQFQKGQKNQFQKGVFRTNCKDCLDRTNLVQGLFAQHSLIEQLKSLQIIQNKSEVENDKDFIFFFRNVWADNGDALSTFYAGTGAIRSDVTRFGKGTYRGLLNDGINSLIRYYLNNFQDGNKQNAMNLVSNYYKPSLEAPSPFLETTTVWLLGFIILLYQSFAPKRIQSFVDLFSVMFWVFFFFFLAFIFRVNRKLLLSKPTLVPQFDHKEEIKKKKE